MSFESRTLTSFLQLNKQICAFITSVLDDGERSALSPGRTTADTQRTRNWVSSIGGVDSEQNRKAFLQETEITTPVARPLACPLCDWLRIFCNNSTKLFLEQKNVSRKVEKLHAFWNYSQHATPDTVLLNLLKIWNWQCRANIYRTGYVQLGNK
jgi:hypothetical protein